MIPDSLRRFPAALERIIPAMLLMGSLGLAFAPKANAQMTLTITETGEDLVFAYSGSWASFEVNHSELSDYGLLTESGFLGALGGWASSASTNSVTMPWSAPFLSGGVLVGDSWGISSDGTRYAPLDYTAFSPISGTLTFASTTLEDLVIAADSGGVLDFGSGNTVSWSTVGASAVPEPNTFAALVGMVALGWCALRRRVANHTA